jgi:hypothetical protein
VSGRAIELADEVCTIRRSLDGLRHLAELATALPKMDDTPSPSVVCALADVISARLRLVEKVLRGSIDPAVLLTPSNVAIGDEGGVRLVAWDASQRKAEAERQLRALEFEARALKRRKRR